VRAQVESQLSALMSGYGVPEPAALIAEMRAAAVEYGR
jgi:hypothetical protein